MRRGIRCHESAPQKYLRHAAFDNPEGRNLPETTSQEVIDWSIEEIGQDVCAINEKTNP
jgi:hypothetical protein